MQGPFFKVSERRLGDGKKVCSVHGEILIRQVGEEYWKVNKEGGRDVKEGQS